MLQRSAAVVLAFAVSLLVGACASSYKAQPVSFELPQRYPNAAEIAGATVAAQAYADGRSARQAFGFDAVDAGLLPVQVVFDNRGQQSLAINPAQTFLEDAEGRLWPVLDERFAYERVTKYAQTKQIFREGAYGGFLGGVAGALLGAAVGVVGGEDVAKSTREGAAAGAAGGAVLGGGGGLATGEQARQRVMADFRAKSLQNRAVAPGDIAYGFIFFPGEAKTARTLRLQLIEQPGEIRRTHIFMLNQGTRSTR